MAIKGEITGGNDFSRRVRAQGRRKSFPFPLQPGTVAAGKRSSNRQVWRTRPNRYLGQRVVRAEDGSDFRHTGLRLTCLPSIKPPSR